MTVTSTAQTMIFALQLELFSIISSCASRVVVEHARNPVKNVDYGYRSFSGGR